MLCRVSPEDGGKALLLSLAFPLFAVWMTGISIGPTGPDWVWATTDVCRPSFWPVAGLHPEDLDVSLDVLRDLLACLQPGRPAEEEEWAFMSAPAASCTGDDQEFSAASYSSSDADVCLGWTGGSQRFL